MRKLLVTLVILGVSIFSLAATALAADPHSIPTNPNPTGQPSQSCQNQSTLTTPGNASNASNTGAPFSPNGTSGGVYANGPGTGGPGTATGAGHITNSNAVSQYDVACFQNSQPGHP
jgi:hypothetical protein